LAANPIKVIAVVDAMVIINMSKPIMADFSFLTHIFVARKNNTDPTIVKISDNQQSWGYEDGPSKGPGPRSAGGR
jgi:hypothetical protein